MNEIKADVLTDEQTDRQPSDFIRAPFFLKRYGTLKNNKLQAIVLHGVVYFVRKFYITIYVTKIIELTNII